MRNTKEKKTDIFMLVLVVLFVVLVFLSTPKGYVYGSSTDWLSQHTALAETIRDACLTQHTLLPAWLPLGGGSNGFLFSYYGYLRPDVLFGCLFPQIPMVKILVVYMLAGYLISVLLFYRLLVLETESRQAAFFGSVLFLTASCFFHTHRQVMFINYMPFLLAALLSIKRKRERWTVLFLTLVFVNSFYYAIAVFAAVAWYWYGQEKWCFFKKYVRAGLLSGGMAMALLLPTFLAILEHHREGTAASDIPGFLPRQTFFLYHPYGMGLTAVCLYLLLAGLAEKEYRRDSLCGLLISSFGIFAWLLNGTLYARGKILIPFVPLVIMHAIKVLLAMHRGGMRWQWYPFVPLLGCLWVNRNAKYAVFMAVDIFLIFLLCLFGARGGKERSGKQMRGAICAGILLMSGICYLQNARGEGFVKKEMLCMTEKAGSEIERAEKIPEDEKEENGLEICPKEPAYEELYRRESLCEPLNTANRSGAGRGKSAMYSSVTNPDYASFYYDLMMTPIQINNRIALLPEENPFLMQLMGVRYLMAPADKVPAGYQVIARKDGWMLAENPDVLPMAYLVHETMAEDEFGKLEPYEKLAALTRTTVVAETDVDLNGNRENAECRGGFREKGNGMQEITMKFSDCRFSDELIITPLPDGGYDIGAEKDGQVWVSFEQPVRDSVLLLEFAVENETEKAVIIDINRIRNKLSGKKAPYPNENNCFHYQFSEENGNISGLHINLSEGHYRIYNIKWHTFPEALLTEKDYTPLQIKKEKVPALGSTRQKCGISLGIDRGRAAHTFEILSGIAASEDADFLVTSIPRQRGLKIFIDGREIPAVTVNTAFAGAEYTAGMHEIDIRFTPPGLCVGYWVSLASTVVYLMWCLTAGWNSGLKTLLKIRKK